MNIATVSKRNYTLACDYDLISVVNEYMILISTNKGILISIEREEDH